jgi:excinuclease UvrABC nuclease subunit
MEFKLEEKEFNNISLDEKYKLPKLPAIYILKSDDKIIYVGKTKNIYNRILMHRLLLANSEYRLTCINNISYYIVYDIEKLDILENIYIYNNRNEYMYNTNLKNNYKELFNKLSKIVTIDDMKREINKLNF